MTEMRRIRSAWAKEAEDLRQAALVSDIVAMLEEVKRACLFADNATGLTCSPYIPEDMFNRICAVLARAQKPTVQP